MASEQNRRAKAEREAKLADALRVNLRRRKAQARATANECGSGAPLLADEPGAIGAKRAQPL